MSLSNFLKFLAPLFKILRTLLPSKPRPRISKCVLEAKDVLEDSTSDSSVARGGRSGRYSPHIGLSAKMQNKKNTTFLALLALFFALEWTKKRFKAFIEIYIQEGG